MKAYGYKSNTYGELKVLAKNFAKMVNKRG